MRKTFRIFSFLAALIICAPLRPAAALTPAQTGEYINGIAGFISDNYVFDISREELYKAALMGVLNEEKPDFDTALDSMFAVLDPNSAYIYPENYQSYLSDITGDFSGIGVNIAELSGQVVVITPIEGSPAHRAGIRPNDIIVSVNGEDVTALGLEDISGRVLGEPGSEVSVGFLRGGAVFTHTFIRERIENNPVSYKTLDGGIGYIKITTFNSHTVENVKKALEAFDGGGIHKIIIDLRYNPGGELGEVVELCGLFVPKGPVAYVKYKDSRFDETFYSELEDLKYTLAVLINEGSASASELFSGAVKDTKSGKIIGAASFGKGTVQTIFPLLNGGGLRLTMAEYLTARGLSIHQKGILPDISVQNTYKAVDISDFSEIDFSGEYGEGSEGDAVLAIEQRLYALRFLSREPGLVYDEETAAAVALFQIANLFPGTGAADLYTLLYLNNEEYNIYYEVDNQLDAAVEYLSGQ